MAQVVEGRKGVEVAGRKKGSELVAEIREGAEVITGPNALEVAVARIKEFGLPEGLLPLENVVECGYVKETGYVWVNQKKKIEHTFKKIDKNVSYGTEITAYVEKGRLKKLTGVKAKELLLWVSIVDISLDPSADKVQFTAFAGISKTFPAEAFALGQ